jgi:hypothetical protein
MLEVEDSADCADALVSLALAAGAPDNVTCVIGDIVDIHSASKDKPAPNQIVGSAARDRKRPTQGSTSSAGRAAKLSSTPADDDEEEHRAGRWTSLKPWLLPFVALVTVVAALWGAYAWSQTQYYVGTEGDSVVIYRGIPQELGPLTLHHVIESTAISVDSLAPFQRERVDASIRTSDLSEARAIVTSLEGAG